MTLVLTLALCSIPPTALADSKPAKVVVQLTTGDLETFESRILGVLSKLATHYAGEEREFSAVVVVHGEAYRFFLKALEGTPYVGDDDVKAAQARLRKGIAKLREAHGVRFEICKAGMKKRGLEKGQFYDGVHFATNAFVALVDWQNDGYAYMPVR